MMKDIWPLFAFPLNLILAALMAVILLWLRKSHQNSAVMRFLHSPGATISAIIVLIAACVWVGLSGNSSFPQSIIFVLVLLYVQIVLFLITVRGWIRSDGKVRWRFLFLHAEKYDRLYWSGVLCLPQAFAPAIP